MTDSLLEAAKLRKEFGGLVACNDVDFAVPRGSIVSRIGPNGAGKPTFFNMLTGVSTPTSGEILFNGHDVAGLPPHAVTHMGVGRTFQNIRLFPTMTSLENVLVGMHSRIKGGIIRSVLRTPGLRREEREAADRATELLRYCDLPTAADDSYAMHLSYGDQRRLEGGRVSTNGALLRLEDVHTYYGTIEAIKGVSIEVNEGEVVTLIGANGAGKSTTLRSIQGINRPKRGKILFNGKDIVGTPPHEIVRMGISQSPEGRRLFARMSVLENLEMGAFQRRDRSGVQQDIE